MKKILASTSLMVIATSMLTVGLNLSDGIKAVQAREDENRGGDKFECTAAKLSGNYGVLSTGNVVQVPPESVTLVGPFASIGRLTLNSNNTFALSLRQNFNGTIDPPISVPPTQYTGNFTLNNDCTGTFTFANGIIFEFVAVDEGKEIQFMRSQDVPGTRSVITGVAKKQES